MSSGKMKFWFIHKQILCRRSAVLNWTKPDTFSLNIVVYWRFEPTFRPGSFLIYSQGIHGKSGQLLGHLKDMKLDTIGISYQSL